LRKLPKIDEIDTVILQMLLRDSRTSFTKIAKECHITVGAVRMRYRNLWKKGVIKGEIMMLNPHSLGYEYVVDIGVTANPGNAKDVADFLENLRQQYKHMNIVGPFGKYNLFAVVVCHNLRELNKIIADLESHPHVKQVESMIWAETVHLEHMENLFFGTMTIKDVEKRNSQFAKFSNEKAKLDQIDRKITKILVQNARTPFRKISKELHISTKSVIQRYKRLKGAVLTSATISVDLKKLGFNAFAFFFIKTTNRSKVFEVSSQLLKIPNLAVFLRLLGPYDLNVDVFVSDFKELFEATEQIRKIPHIETMEIYVTPVWDEWPPNLFLSLL
jgi:Lrp/AsnC family transcriptional regulator for asnA, asnC and gidA